MLLMEPETIGTLKLGNRLVMLGTHLGYCEEGIVSEKLVEFYRARAMHRPGLIIAGGCYTEHLAMGSPTMIGISDDSHIPGLSELVDVIHEYDVPVAAQLYHSGRYAHSVIIGEKSVSASEVECRLTRETSRALTIEEIKETVDRFGRAAARAKEAGFDAVEILGSAGYLLNQFMAPATNKREDEYGGSLENRARFAIETVQSVRDAVGNDFPVIYRISGEDFVPDGITLETNKTIVQWLEKARIDCLNVTGGWHETRVPQITMDVPRGHYAYLAETLAEVVDVPVVACNRINSPRIAESILSRGKARLIGMSRGFIADPEITEKVRSGRYSEIRPCIGCNLGCLDSAFMLEPVTCALNPQSGFETERSLGPDAEGRIAVIGAGPAGMEAARVLALRGYSVTIYEKASVPGGLLRLAAKVPGRGEFGAYTTHMWRELRRLGVELKLSTSATVYEISAESFDFVVYAAGTVAGAPPIDGIEIPHVASAYDVIENEVANPGRVVVIGGGALGCYAALYLARSAESVHLLEEGDRIGEDLGRTTRWVIMKNLRERGVQMMKSVEITQVTHQYVMIGDGPDSAFLGVDTVVVATKPQPNDRLLDLLRSNGIKTNAIGSISRPMNLLETVHEAFQFAANFELEQ